MTFYYYNKNLINFIMMKLLYISLIVIVLFLAGCCDCETSVENSDNLTGNNALLPSTVTVKHNISFDRQTGGEDWSGGLNLKEFIYELYQKAVDGKIKTFDPDYIPADFVEQSIDELKNKAGVSVDTFAVENPTTGEFDTQIVKSDVNMDEIKTLHFTENWFFDKEKFELNKEVVGIDIVREFPRYFSEDESEVLMTKIASLHFDNPIITLKSKDIKNKQLLAENIKYELDLEKYISWTDELNQEIFLNLIMEKVKNDDIEIFDFFDNSIKYTYAEIRAQNPVLCDTLVVIDPATALEKEIIVDNELNTQMIKSYIFLEDWYYDPDTYKIVKTVKGIAPVLHYFNDADIDDVQKKILFLIYFN